MTFLIFLVVMSLAFIATMIWLVPPPAAPSFDDTLFFDDEETYDEIFDEERRLL